MAMVQDKYNNKQQKQLLFYKLILTEYVGQ